MKSNARPFNPHLCAVSTNLKNLIEEVLQQIAGYEEYYGSRKRARSAAAADTHKHIVEALICDLCALNIVGDAEAIHLPLTNRVLNKHSRYKGRALSKTLPDVLAVLGAEEMEFIKYEKGKTLFTALDVDLRQVPAGGVQTIVMPGPKLLSRIERFQIQLADIGHSPQEEVILLRGPKPRQDIKGPEEEYEDTEETHRLRSELQTINAWLQAADIRCDSPRINPYDRRLRRIYNNGEFQQGGRLYGGFWQGMSSDDRAEHIRMNGDAIVELDYGQMSMMLYYAEAGLEPPEADHYDLSEQGIGQQYRKGIKTVIQALLNSEKPLTRFPKGTKDLFPKKVQFKDVMKAIEEKHRELYPLMTSGLGMKMFRKESDILMAVLLSLKEQGIVALPIHDAVLVADEDAARTRDTMIKVFRKYTGLIPKVTQE